MSDEETPRIAQYADDAYESIRAINHPTIALDGGIPAPIVYQLLGNLKTAGGYGRAQALEQHAGGLGRSLAGYDVYEADGSHPAQTISAW